MFQASRPDPNFTTILITFFHDSIIILPLKAKAIPLQAWTGPEGSRSLRLSDFKADTPHALGTNKLPATPNKKFTVAEVRVAINKRRTTKAPGYDVITGEILKKLPEVGLSAIIYIYNSILRTGYFPGQWKVSQIVTILKPQAHHFLHVTRIRVKSLTLRLLMSYIYIYIYIYGAPILDVSRSHTTTHHCR